MATAIVPHDVSLPAGCELTATGLRLPPGLPFGTWEAIGPHLRVLEERIEAALQTIRWAQADWLRYGEHEYGEKYAQAVEVTGLSGSRLATLNWLADKTFRRRKYPMTIEHHVAVAALDDPDEADALLDEAERKGWSSHRLYRERLDGEARADGRDPAVARAERALERARTELEGLELEVQINLVWRLLLEPLDLAVEI